VSVFCRSFYAEEDFLYYERRGIIQYNEKMYSFSEESLQMALRINPSAYMSLNYLAFISLAKENRRGAKKLFNDSLNINPNQYEILNAVADIEDYYGNNSIAEKLYLKSLEIHNDNTRALLGMARLLYLSKRMDEAAYYFDKAKNNNITISDSSLNEARNLRAKNKIEDAIEILKRGISANPADERLYFELDSILRSKNDNRTSLKYLRQMTYLNPCNDKAYFHIANLFLSGGIHSKRNLELDLGINAVKKAIELNKNEEEYCLLLISFYKLKKDTINFNKAVENCNKTMKISTDNN